MLVASFTLVLAGNPQVDKLFEDYFEWKIDTFKVSLLFEYTTIIVTNKYLFSNIITRQDMTNMLEKSMITPKNDFEELEMIVRIFEIKQIHFCN